MTLPPAASHRVVHACSPARSSPLCSPQLWPPFFVPPHCFASVNWSLEPLHSGLEPTLKARGGASRWKEETHLEARAHLDLAAAARSPVWGRLINYAFHHRRGARNRFSCRPWKQRASHCADACLGQPLQLAAVEKWVWLLPSLRGSKCA